MIYQVYSHMLYHLEKQRLKEKLQELRLFISLGVGVYMQPDASFQIENFHRRYSPKNDKKKKTYENSCHLVYFKKLFFKNIASLNMCLRRDLKNPLLIASFLRYNFLIYAEILILPIFGLIFCIMDPTINKSTYNHKQTKAKTKKPSFLSSVLMKDQIKNP